MSPQPENAETQPAAEAKVSADGTKHSAIELTPEEQMALFEKELKESDWGHQPC